MKKIFLLIFIFTGFFISTKAQSSKEIHDSTVVIIFNHNGAQSSSAHAHKRTKEDNIIKIAPLGFISGSFPILYERVITDFFTVQVGGGLTNKDYIRAAFQKASGDDGTGSGINLSYPWGNNNSAYSDVSEPLFSFVYRTATMGYMFTVQPRLYLESNSPEDQFIGISYDYYHYGFSIPGIVDDGAGSYAQTGSPQSEHENIGDIMVHFGSQSVYDNLTVEYTTGIGLRNVSGTKYVADYNYSTNNVDYQGFATYKQTLFNYEIGLKVGYHF
jgi:hypothetical protein